MVNGLPKKIKQAYGRVTNLQNFTDQLPAMSVAVFIKLGVRVKNH